MLQYFFRGFCLNLLLIAAACQFTVTGNRGDEATPAVGACYYVNPFSSNEECKLYSGVAWTSQSATDDCLKGPLGSPGEWVEEPACNLESALGSCLVTPDDGLDYVLSIGGEEARQCSAGAMACTAFAGGVIEAGENCRGYDTSPMSTDSAASTVFQWPTKTCKPALEGEPPGQTDGEVCTWNLISGSTEEGRRYVDYGDCSVVHTNRPYYPLPPWQVPPVSDPRLEDASWLREAKWVKSQVRSSACICCHSEDAAPRGPSRWSVDAGPLWVDTMSDEAIVLFAGHTDSSVLGAFDPADNNGFNREESAMPTTDVDRMLGFFLGEIERRGIGESYIRDLPDVGGPLLRQQAYTPEACEEGEGIDAEGRLIWKGGPARYLYVLEADAKNPGLPPNFDMPDGLVWRVDVPHYEAPFVPPLVYGEVPASATQRFPERGTAPTLISGASYYLYVLRDVAIPISRCLFRVN